MATKQQKVLDFKTTSALLLIAFTLVFFFMTMVKYSGTNIGFSGWDIFKSALENLGDMFKHGLKSFYVYVCIFGIPVMIFLSAYNLFNERFIELKKNVIWLITFGGILLFFELVLAEEHRGIKEVPGTGMWLSLIVSVVWFLYIKDSKIENMDSEDEEEADKLEKETVEVEETIIVTEVNQTPVETTTIIEVDKLEEIPVEVAENEPVATAVEPEANPISSVVAKMSLDNLKDVLAAPQIYAPAFVEAARAELARRQSVK